MELFRKRWFAAVFMVVVILLSIGIGMLRSWEENKRENRTAETNTAIVYSLPAGEILH